MQEGLDAKSVRFDVYTKDDKRIFDIEIQTTNQKNLPKRARYYQSIIDMDNLSHGEKYSQLKDSYIIFLCLSDPFDEKLPMYFFWKYMQIRAEKKSRRWCVQTLFQCVRVC